MSRFDAIVIGAGQDVGRRRESDEIERAHEDSTADAGAAEVPGA
jgi:hypothetical protein